MSREYVTGVRAHNIANELGIEYGAAWRVAQCMGKKRYRTEAEAREVADEWGQEPYRCELCGCWHNRHAEAEE